MGAKAVAYAAPLRLSTVALAGMMTFAVAGVTKSAIADVTKSGPEFQVNGLTTGYQRDVAVAATTDGEFIVVWIGPSTAGALDVNVVGRRVGPGSAPAGDEFLVNVYTTGRQNGSVVAADAEGEFVVVWVGLSHDGDGYGIFGQRFDAAAAPVGAEFQVNTYTTDDQRRVAMAGWDDGRFVVVWESTDQDGADGGIFGQRFDSNGAPEGTEFQVNTYTTNSQYIPKVETLAGGGFVVAWGGDGLDDPDDAFGSGTFAQAYTEEGLPLGTEFQVNTYTTDTQSNVAIAARSDGGFTIVWEDFEQDPSGHGIFAQRYDDTAERVGSEFQLDASTGNQFRPTATDTPDSGLIAVWHDDGHDGSSSGLFARAFDKNGSPVGSEFQVNTTTENDQFRPAIASHADGQMLVVWGSSAVDFGDVIAQRLTGSTTPSGTCGEAAGSSLAAGSNTRNSSPRRAVLRADVLPRVFTASDALAVLRKAIGLQECELCVCDVDGSGAVTATDALITLKVAVGQTIELQCPPC